MTRPLNRDPLVTIPEEGVYWDRRAEEARIVLVLDVDQAEGIADSLGSGDGGAREIMEWVAVARDHEKQLEEQRAETPRVSASWWPGPAR